MVFAMENMQFHIEDNKFECVECGNIIEISEQFIESIESDPDQKPLPLTCDECGTEYLIALDPTGPGLIATVKTSSEPELISETERELEEE